MKTWTSRWHRVYAAALLTFCFPFAAFSQNATSLSGKITDAETGNALEGAVVRLLEQGRRTTTDRFGIYRLPNLSPGNVQVFVSAPGYTGSQESVVLNPGDNVANLNMRFSEEVFELEVYEVNGQIGGTARALAKQSAADNRIDIVASDSFGQLPDTTVADAVRRLPGISVEKDDQGRAGRYVSIRGLNSDFNTVSINGQKLMVSNFDGASRSVPLDVLSADSAESVEVTKSVLPSQDGDAIGGSINIRTRSAFDASTSYMKLEGAIGYNDLSGQYSGDYPHDSLPFELSAAWADYLNSDQTSGLALTVSYSDRPYLFQSIENGPYQRIVVLDSAADPGLFERLQSLGSYRIFDIDADSFFEQFDEGPLDGAYVPTYGRLEEAFDNVQTLGLSGRYDYRPSEDFSLSLSLSYTERETNQGSQRADARFDANPEYIFDEQVDGGTLLKFTGDDRLARRVRDFYESQEVLTAVVNVEQKVGNYDLDYGAGFDRGDFAGDEDDTSAQFVTGFRLNDFDGTSDPFNPRYSSNITETGPGSYFFDDIQRGTREILDESFSLHANLSRSLLWGSLPGTVTAGLKGTWRDRDFDDTRIRFRSRDADPSLEYYLDGVFIDGEQVYGSLVADYNADETIQGQNFGFMIDPVKVREAEAAILAHPAARAYGNPQEFLGRNPERDARQELVNSYDAEEQILAGFLETRFEWEKLTLIAGLRLEHTEIEFDTFGGDFFQTDPTAPDFVSPIRGENDYTSVLPGLHLRYDYSENLVIRASANRTIARPSYRQLNPSIDYDPFAFADFGLAIVGNTQLDPTMSTNVDLSVDYYFGQLSRLSAALFYKDMSDNVYRIRRPVLPGDPDYLYSLDLVDQFLNAEGAKVTGIELSFDLSLGEYVAALTGLSFSGNLTVVDSEVDGLQRIDDQGRIVTESGDTPLFGQVDLSGNLSLLFSRWGFEGRFAFNYTDDYLDFGGIDLDKNLDNYLDSRERWDLSASYFVTSGIQVFGEIQNLFDNDSASYEGNRTRLFYREERGRTFFLGVRYLR